MWTANSFDLSSYVGQTVYVAVKATDTDKFELYVDNVLSGVAPVAPECATSPFPADVAVSVPNGVVTFTWEAPASGVTPTSYDLYGGETTSLEFGLIGNFTSLSADLTISGFDTTIYWQIVPNNYGVAAEGCPIWSFTTVSPPLPIVPTYSADFSSYPADRWTEASGAYGEPSGDSSGFAGDDFGNDTAHPNGRSARINVWGSSTDEYLISPAFNLEGASYYLNFDIAYTAFSTTAAATFGSDDYVALLVTEDGTTWTELMRWDDSGSLSNTGESISELALTGYGADVKFAFYGFSDTSNEDNNFYIDNFQITTTTLGVAKNSIENFSLFPTLAKDEISFTSQEVVDTFMVYNLLGQQVFSKKINAKTAALNLTVLKKGMYLVKVTSGNSTGTYKIIKE